MEERIARLEAEVRKLRRFSKAAPVIALVAGVAGGRLIHATPGAPGAPKVAQAQVSPAPAPVPEVTPPAATTPAPKKKKKKNLLFRLASRFGEQVVVPLALATVAKKLGHDPAILLRGEAASLLKDDVAAATTTPGFDANAQQLLQQASKLNIPIYVGEKSSEAFGVTPQDLKEVDAKIISDQKDLELMLEADQTISP